MKKFLAMALVLAMAISMVVIPTAADEGTNITGQSNMEVTAYAFGTAPTIDGAITEAEWGRSVVIADSATANNDDSTSASANNTYFQNYGGQEINANMKYELWLGWDATYFYVGAVIDDPSGYNVPAGRANIWNADCLQFRIDPLGPDSVQAASEDGFDYKTTAFNVDKYERPWAYHNDVCNIGVADTGKTKTPVQVVDLCDAAGAVLLNDGRSVAAGYQAKVAVAPCGETAGKTTIEVAVPFAWLLNYVSKSEPERFKSNEDGTYDGIGVGSVLGMSVGVLDSTFGSDGYASLLCWGSGVFGHQWDKTNPGKLWDNGGSNAVILSDKDAVTGATVEGLPTVSTEEVVPEHKEMALYFPMDDGANYFQAADYDGFAVGNGYAVAQDVCILDTNVQDESRSAVGWWFGNEYNDYAGYDCSTQSFVFGRQQAANGVNHDAIFKQSAKFEWKKAADNENGGTWHNLGLRVVGDVATLYCDGVEVLTCEHPSFGHKGNWAEGSLTDFVPYTEEEIAAKKAEDEDFKTYEEQVVIFYNSAECYADNLTLAGADYNFAERDGDVKIFFNCDADDMVYRKSWARRSHSAAIPQVEIVCGAEDAQGYVCGHEWIITSATATEITRVCDVCGETETVANEIGLEPFGSTAPDRTPGDANNDGNFNAKDASAIAKLLAGWTIEINTSNADVNADGTVNAKDLSQILKKLAGWDIELK